MTNKDLSVTKESRVAMSDTDFNCEAVNSGADSFSYVVLKDTDMDATSKFTMIKVAPSATTNGVYTQFA